MTKKELLQEHILANFPSSCTWVNMIKVSMLNRLFASGEAFMGEVSGVAYLSSAIPANALYHAKNAAKSPKYPPAESSF